MINGNPEESTFQDRQSMKPGDIVILEEGKDDEEEEQSDE